MTDDPTDLPSYKDVPSDSPELDELCLQLEAMRQKGQQVTESLRGLANHTDELMVEVMQFKQVLNHYRPETAQSLHQPALQEIVSLQPSPLPVEQSQPAPETSKKANLRAAENLPPDMRDEKIAPGKPVTASWLELAATRSDSAKPDALPPATIQPGGNEQEIEQNRPDAPLPSAWTQGRQTARQRPAIADGPEAASFAPERDAETCSSASDYEKMEFNLGIKWLSRIGIVAILAGLAMALCYTFPNFSREMKLLTGMLLALGFFGGGSKLYNPAPVLGRILQGGGLALGYLTLFAMFFIPQVRLIDSSMLGYALLFGYTGVVMALSHRLKSQTTAILGLVFGYYSAGYAVSYEVAFVSTAILMLGNAGLTRLHPEWRWATKANLLGALWTYCHWRGAADLTSRMPAMIYLCYTYALFHVIAVLRANQGDALLNVANTVICYFLFQLAQPWHADSSVPEFIVGAVQLGSLIWVYRARPAQRDEALPYSLLILGLTFSSMGMAHFYSHNIKTVILSALAIGLGSLGKRGVYAKVMNVTAYLFIVWGGANLILHWSSLNEAEEMWNGLSLIVSSFILEATAFRAHPAALRSVLLVYTSLIYFSEIMDAMPDHFRTLSFVVSGFIWLAFGFANRRKMYRILGLSWIFVIGGFSIIGDFFYLETLYKILLFILLGAGLLAGSYGYVLLEKRLCLNTATNTEPGLRTDNAI